MAVVAALVVSALLVGAVTLLVHDSMLRGLADFAVFGGLAAATAGILGWESARDRYCPRCGRENARGAAVCAGCDYDMATSPRFACSEGCRVAYEPGTCDCGRRLLALTRRPSSGHHMLLLVVLAGLLLVAAVLLALQLVIPPG